MASPVIASSASDNTSGTNKTSWSITKPSGTVDDDWLLLCISVDGTPSITVPSGFEEIRLVTNSTHTVGAWAKRASSEGAGYSITTGASEQGDMVMMRVTGCTATTLAEFVNAVSVGLNNGTFAPLLAPYITTPDTLIVSLCGSDAGGSAAITKPGAFTSVYSATGTGTTDASISISYLEQAAAGYPTETSNTLSAADEWISITIVINSTTTESAYPAHAFIAGIEYRSPVATLALVYDKPWGTVDGDLLVLIQSADVTAVLSNPGSAFTSRHDTSNTAIWLQILSRIASSEGSSYTGSNTTSSAKQGALLRIKNHDPSAYWNNSTVNSGTSSAPAVTAFTPSVDNGLNLVGMAADDDDVTNGAGFPSGFTGIFSLENTASNDNSMILARNEQTTAASTGTAAMSMDASEEWIAFNILIAPEISAPANVVGGPMQNLMGGFIANYGGQGFIDPTIQKIGTGT